MNTELVEHLRYHAWATRRALEMAQQLPAGEAARELNSSHGGVLGTLAHMFMADRMWWSRLQGKGRSSLADPGEEFTLESLSRDWPPLHEQYIRWAGDVPDEGWDRVLSFVTTTGVRHDMPVRRVILHLVNHGSTHRGQVIAMVRQLGGSPVTTDLMVYYRSLTEAKRG